MFKTEYSCPPHDYLPDGRGVYPRGENYYRMLYCRRCADNPEVIAELMAVDGPEEPDADDGKGE